MVQQEALAQQVQWEILVQQVPKVIQEAPVLLAPLEEQVQLDPLVIPGVLVLQGKLVQLVLRAK